MTPTKKVYGDGKLCEDGSRNSYYATLSYPDKFVQIYKEVVYYQYRGNQQSRLAPSTFTVTRLTKHGKIVVSRSYMKKRKRNWRDTTYSVPISKHILGWINSKGLDLGEGAIKNPAHSLAAWYNHKIQVCYAHAPFAVRLVRNTKNIHVITRRLLGRSSKALAKEVGKCIQEGKWEQLRSAQDYANAFGNQIILDILRRSESLAGGWHEVLTRFPTAAQVLENSEFHLLSNTINMHRQLRAREIKPVCNVGNLHTFRRNHDRLAVQFHTVQKELSLKTLQKPFPLPDQVKKLPSLTIEELTLEPARSGTDLVAWGAKLQNCMGSYIERIHDQGGDQTLFVLKDPAGEPRYGIDVHKNKLQQFVGKRNTPAPIDLVQVWALELQRHRIIDQNIS